MNLDDLKIIYFSITALIVISIYSPLIMEHFPAPREESFFALALLGKEGLAENYYPGEEPIVYPDTPVKWHIYIYNHMGESQQIKIKIKLVDSNTPPPNITTCTPSPTTEIFEIRRFILNNETLIIPFEWSISEVIEVNDRYKMSLMQVNDYPINIDMAMDKEEALKMVFELWVYDENTRDFVFGWSERGDSRCVWNQIQFYLNMRSN